MALPLMNTVDVIELMENYVEAIRPSEDIRDMLDISYEIEDQSVVLFEIRPSWSTPGEKIHMRYAKATFVKKTNTWKVLWMRASGQWNIYKPMPEVPLLEDFLDLVEEDKYRCFKG
ncbi:DUF3024 domain-containing protein [Paraflavitalea pollutisoli]|uniref:DUF3024 domain-containing protein n=1 Tax=Paraflavitalea pollutisoli TaxID=3034143 RepID=UPI0023EDCEA9|nr:DUF3024 domain-containing protein [Paraflavitalea sp. H1-2-19X]